jgi:hypothetical protein
MPTQQADSQGASSAAQGIRQRDSLIAQHVIRALGTPDGMQMLQIRPLWGHCFRVNVLVGPNAVSAKVVHSFFLVTDGLGKVITSTPTIVRQYGVDDGSATPIVAKSTAEGGSLSG